MARKDSAMARAPGLGSASVDGGTAMATVVQRCDLAEHAEGLAKPAEGGPDDGQQEARCCGPAQQLGNKGKNRARVARVHGRGTSAWRAPAGSHGSRKAACRTRAGKEEEGSAVAESAHTARRGQ